jgi:hypothetical protein
MRNPSHLTTIVVILDDTLAICISYPTLAKSYHQRFRNLPSLAL